MLHKNYKTSWMHKVRWEFEGKEKRTHVNLQCCSFPTTCDMTSQGSSKIRENVRKLVGNDNSKIRYHPFNFDLIHWIELKIQ